MKTPHSSKLVSGGGRHPRHTVCQAIHSAGNVPVCVTGMSGCPRTFSCMRGHVPLGHCAPQTAVSLGGRA